MKTLKVSEIFLSIQGEGSRVGTPNIFIRLQGCKAKYACAQLGIKCDTEFESGAERTVEDLYDSIYALSQTVKNIIWTGGEPTDQLDDEIISFFKDKGYYQAIETSGLNPTPKGLDYIVISPKVAEHIIAKNFKDITINELRYVRHTGQEIPNPACKAEFLYISPHWEFNNDAKNLQNVQHCINLVKLNPTWRLSIALHKLINIL